MKLKKILAGILTGTAVLASLAGCGSTASVDNTAKAESTKKSASSDGDSKYDPITVDIGADSAVFSAQFRVAEEAGIFDKYNIKANITTYSYGIDTINGVILGEVQIGEAMDYAVATRAAEGSNLRLVSSILTGQGDSNSLYVNDPSIKTGADLKGKNLAVQSGTVNEYVWAKALESFGLTKDDVNYKPFSSDAEILAAFQSGEVDAAWLSKQFTNQIAQLKNVSAISTYGDIGVTNVAYLVVDNSFLNEHEEAVERVIKALNEATDIINNDPDTAAKYVSDSLGLAKEDAKNGFGTYTYKIDFTQDEEQHILDIADWSIKNGLIKDSYDLSKYIVTEPIKNALPDATDLK